MDEPTPYDPYYEQFITEQTNANPLDPLAGLAGIMAGGLIIYLIFTAAIIALGIWIWYTVTWRAIRRGLHEFHHNQCPPKLHKTRRSRSWTPNGW